MHRINDLLKECIPNDHSVQVAPGYYLDYLFAQGKNIKQVMDLGCGSSHSRSYFQAKDADIQWFGLDVGPPSLIPVLERGFAEFIQYNGQWMPFANDSFDLIYCRQVLEHVRYPVDVLQETCRVLKPGGFFVGSTSQLEPYHAYSVWNYTPYGFQLLLQQANLELLEIRPSIDSLTLIIRRGLGRPQFFTRWWEKESPLNQIIGLGGRAIGKDHAWINALKLIFCGQFSFLVHKPV